MRHVFLLFAFTVAALFAVAQSGGQRSYNYQRALEAVENEDYNEAMRYFQKAVEENPKDGYSYMWITQIYAQTPETYGKALSASNMALKHIPKKDNKGRSVVWYIRAKVYVDMEQIENASECFDRAIALCPKEITFYECRADWLYSLNLYDESDADFQKIIDLDNGYYIGYMGLGRNALGRGDYEVALAYLEQARKLDPTFAQIYAFQAECYFGLKDYGQAVDNLIKTFEIDPANGKAFYQMFVVADSAFDIVCSKVKVKMIQEPQNPWWPYCMGMLYFQSEHYAMAIDHLKQSFHLMPNPLVAYYVADAYVRLSRPQQALPYVEQALAMDSTHVRWRVKKADIEFELGNFDQALRDYIRSIAIDSDEAYAYYCYYKIGWIRELRHDYDAALRDYTTGLSLAPGYAYLYWERGDLQRRHFNNQRAADKDFRQVLLLDTVVRPGSCRHYALLALGRSTEADDWMRQIIALDSSDSGVLYDAACFYSLMRDSTRALSHLRLALENGYTQFAHIDFDDDLDFIRPFPVFRRMVNEHRVRFESSMETPDTIARQLSGQVVEIPFILDGNLCKVQCEINGLPLHFIFDTGASHVTISTVEATFMLKNDYLLPPDFLGRQDYMTADGSIREGITLNIRRLDFGPLTLPNVRATVVKNQRAPLLLGQSVLGRLGKIEIDNDRRFLRITPWYR